MRPTTRHGRLNRHGRKRLKMLRRLYRYQISAYRLWEIVRKHHRVRP